MKMQVKLPVIILGLASFGFLTNAYAFWEHVSTSTDAAGQKKVSKRAVFKESSRFHDEPSASAKGSQKRVRVKGVELKARQPYTLSPRV